MPQRTYSLAAWLCPALLAFFILANSCIAAEEVAAASVRRPDPRTSELVPIAADQIKPGKIYNHFSHLHNRYVWAYAKENGQFSYALGVGTTELPANFDPVTSTSETNELVEAQAGPWAERSRLQQSQIYVRLGLDNKWKVVPGRSIRSHFDLDSSRRWEWHGKRRVAVLHTYGNLWGHDGNRYLPH